MKINKCTQICVTGHKKLCLCPPQCASVHQDRRWHSPPPSCAVTQNHIWPECLCTSIYRHRATHTHTRTHAHAHTHTNSAKLEMKEKVPFSTGGSYKLGSLSHQGFHRHTVFLAFFSPRRLAIYATLKRVKDYFSDVKRQFLMKILPFIPENGSLPDRTSNTFHCASLSWNDNIKPRLILAYLKVREGKSH